MMELRSADITYEEGWAVWPALWPRPAKALLSRYAQELCGYPAVEWSQVTSGTYRLPKVLAALVLRRHHCMSFPELARVLGYKAHSSLGSKRTLYRRFSQSESGKILHNALIEKLHADIRDAEEVAALPPKRFDEYVTRGNPAPFDAKAITRASLRGNAGGAV